jgi:hypothetical protein
MELVGLVGWGSSTPFIFHFSKYSFHGLIIRPFKANVQYYIGKACSSFPDWYISCHNRLFFKNDAKKFFALFVFYQPFLRAPFLIPFFPTYL